MLVSNAAGYQLTKVTFLVNGTIPASLQVRIESSGPDNKPGGSLGAPALTRSGTTTTTGINPAASTTYFVVPTGGKHGRIQ